MPLTLETGAGLSNSNAYADAAYASSYFADHLFGANWFDHDSTTQDQALIYASRTLDDLIQWFGFRQYATQALEWPRFSVFDRDSYLIPTNTVPDVVRRACCDQAMYSIQHGAPSPNVTPGPEQVRIGPISVKMPTYARTQLPDIVMQSIRGLGQLKSVASGGTGRLIR